MCFEGIPKLANVADGPNIRGADELDTIGPAHKAHSISLDDGRFVIVVIHHDILFACHVNCK
jgi:hypothetical protein